MFALPVSALPTDTYTHIEAPGEKTEIHLAREMYSPAINITASSLGLEEKLEGITDIFCNNDGSLLILCSESSRVIILNADYTLKAEISVTDENGNKVDFKGAQGIFQDNDGAIYIANTNNGNILVIDSSGKLTNIMETPQSKLIPPDFSYQPIKIAKDSDGYMYILSMGCYYGALMYNPEKEFMGFYGANTVEANALDTLEYLWERLTSNEEKKKASVKTLPYSFVDFDFDSDDYMVTCTGQTDTLKNGQGQIKKISLNGANILYKRSMKKGYVLSDTVNFLEEELVLKEDRTGAMRTQNMVSIAVDEQDFIYALDKVNGCIYVYDGECNFLNVFGGGLESGKQLGTFITPSCLELKGDSVVVADVGNHSITVFNITEYGKLVKKAQSLYISGDYSDSKELFEQILMLDNGSQLAYRGLAMAYYSEKEYEKALEYAKNGIDYTVYDLAKQKLVSKTVADNFLLIIIAILAFVGAIVFSVIYVKKKQGILIKNNKLRLMCSTTVHPFDSFNDLKYKHQFSVLIGVVLTALLYIAFFFRDTKSGFLYTDVDMRNYNSIYTLGKTIGLIALWSVCNWLVCSMFSGKGKLKEVFCATVYSLFPLIFYSFIRIIFTNLLPLSASGFITAVDIAVWILTFFLLSIGMMIVHEYDFFKLLLTTVVVMFMMILVIFVIFICAIMSKQAINFVVQIYEEIVYR